MDQKPAFDVFLSHSSKDAKVAQALCHYLESQGLRCWIAPRDILPSKDYGEALMDGIIRSRMMVVVFSGHSNRSVHVKSEVERAFSHQLPIIPFRIEDVIPGKSLEFFLSATHWLDALDGKAEDYFEQVGQTCAALATGAPPPSASPRPQRTRRRKNRRLVLLSVLGLATLAASIAIPLWLTDQREKIQIANGVVGDMATQFARINVDLGEIRYSSDTFQKLAALPSDAAIQDLIGWVDKQLEEKDFDTSAWSEATKKNVARTAMPLEDVQAFYTMALPQFQQSRQSYYRLLRAHLQMPPTSWLARLPEFFSLDAQSLEAEASGTYYAFLELLNTTPPETRALFLKLYGSLGNLPQTSALTTDQARAEQERVMQRMNGLVADMAGILPEGERDVEALAAQIEALNQKKALVETRKDQVAVAQKELEEARERLREKFKLQKDDDPGLMWGKILKFASVKLWDDAAQNCRVLVQWGADREPEVKLYGPTAAAYYREQKAKVRTLGVIVSAIENGATHSVLRVGDIITKSRGADIAMPADLVEAAKRGGEKVLEILRPDDQGALVPLTVTAKPDDPRVGVLPLLRPTD